MYRRRLIASMPFLCMCTMTACGGAADANVDTAAAAEAPAEAAGISAAALDAVRVANERFADVNVALAEGYMQDPTGECVTADMTGHAAADGAMGIHYFRPDLLGLVEAPGRANGTGMHTDFMKPAVLMYEPQADGSMKLVGVENLVWTAAWEQAGNTAPPSWEGQPYFQMTDDPATEVDEAHGFESHYDLHLWLYRDNPTQVYAQYNPAVTCEHAAHKMPGM
jgi:hypothetical protein